MRYTILEELRALDIDNASAVGVFIRNAQKTFVKIWEEWEKIEKDKLQGAEGITEANAYQILESGPFVTTDDFSKINKICKRIEGIQNDKERENYYPKAMSIYSHFMSYAAEINILLDEALGALNCFTGDFNEEKQNINALKTLYNEKNIEKKGEINELFGKLGINTLKDLSPKVDQMIAEKLTDASDQEPAGEDQSPSQSNEKLDALATLADQLVINAEIRKNTYPRERIVAARLRLSINMQRMHPIDQNDFLAKLKPQLKKAKACFKSSRSRWTVFGRRMSALGIIGSAVAVLAGLGAIAGVAVLFAVAPPVAAMIVGSVAVGVLATTAVVGSGVAVGAIGALRAGNKADARSAARERPAKAIEKISLAMKALDDMLFDEQFQSEEPPEASVGERQAKTISDGEITSLTRGLSSAIKDAKKDDSQLRAARGRADSVVDKVKKKSETGQKEVTIDISNKSLEDAPTLN